MAEYSLERTLQMGKKALKKKDYLKASSYFRSVLEKDPRNLRGVDGLLEAIKTTTKAGSKEPLSSTYIKGLVGLVESGEGVLLEKKVRDLLINRNSRELYHFLAVALSLQEKNQEALAYFDLSIAIQPENRAHLNLICPSICPSAHLSVCLFIC